MATTLSQTTSGINRITITDTLGNVTGIQLANTESLKVGGGANGQILSTDGTGNLVWANSISGSTASQGSDTFTATASQTAFTLSRTPSGSVSMAINGVTVASTAVTNVLTAVTYVQAVNGYTLKAGDRVTFTYVYGSTTATLLGGLGDVVLTAPAAGQLLAYDATASKWINTVGPTAFGNLTSGTSNVTVVTDGNVTVSVAGNANIATFTSTSIVSGANVSLTGANVTLPTVANVHIQGGTSGQVLKTDGAGTLSFGTPGKLVTYCFSTAVYTFPAAYVPTLIKYEAKLYDSQALYDITTGRFQPKVAGWYQILASADVYVSATAEASITIVHSADGAIGSADGFGGVVYFCTGLAYFNGTTDYAYVQGLAQTATTRSQSRGRSSFQAYYVNL